MISGEETELKVSEIVCGKSTVHGWGLFAGATNSRSFFEKIGAEKKKLAADFLKILAELMLADCLRFISCQMFIFSTRVCTSRCIIKYGLSWLLMLRVFEFIVKIICALHTTISNRFSDSNLETIPYFPCFALQAIFLHSKTKWPGRDFEQGELLHESPGRLIEGQPECISDDVFATTQILWEDEVRMASKKSSKENTNGFVERFFYFF